MSDHLRLKMKLWLGDPWLNLWKLMIELWTKWGVKLQRTDYMNIIWTTSVWTATATAVINEPDVNGERDILIVSADLLGIIITYLYNIGRFIRYIYHLFVTYQKYPSIFQEFNRIHHCIWSHSSELLQFIIISFIYHFYYLRW